MKTLHIKDLHASTGETPILHGVDLSVAPGEVVALMGPNGSGKSTLANVLLGHPDYKVTQGHVSYGDHDVLALTPEERAKLGMFLAFQYPQSVGGVNLGNFLRLAYNATHTLALSISDFLTLLKTKLDLLQLPHDFLQRPLNDGLSGGEKKKAEMLQMAVLEPSLVILDETDSGLDVDALKTVGAAIGSIRLAHPEMSWLVITHHQHILEYLSPDKVAVMGSGRIVDKGGREILEKIGKQGFSSLINKAQ